MAGAIRSAVRMVTFAAPHVVNAIVEELAEFAGEMRVPSSLYHAVLKEKAGRKSKKLFGEDTKQHALNAIGFLVRLGEIDEDSESPDQMIAELTDPAPNPGTVQDKGESDSEVLAAFRGQPAPARSREQDAATLDACRDMFFPRSNRKYPRGRTSVLSRRYSQYS